MDVDTSSVQLVGQSAQPSMPDILCCSCGIRIQSNPVNMCMNCLKTRVDVTEGISKQVTLFYCRNCGRYQRPPWVRCELESRELLALCLKKIKGLNKGVKLIDAAFLWTEPHSMRLKVKLTIQKEIYNGAILQQSFTVDFAITNQQCTDCQKSFTEHTWTSVLQVRQKAEHKRTFFYLEQILLKHRLTEKCLSVKEMPQGLDFYYSNRQDAARLLEFLQSVVPCTTKHSRRLISEDDKNNEKRYKFTIYVEIAPICKDDMVCIDPKLAQTMGGICPVLLCHRVTAGLHFIDPLTLRLVDLSAGTYWHHPCPPIVTRKQLIEFIVLDVEKADSHALDNSYFSDLSEQDQSSMNSKSVNKYSHKLQLALVTVAKSADLGKTDTSHEVISHLGHILRAGDLVLGYDMSQAVLGKDALNAYKNKQNRQFPDILLVRKTYPKSWRRARTKNRNWKLKRMATVTEERVKKGQEEKDQEDMEQFMNDVEEDEELRKTINVYKDADKIAFLAARKAARAQAGFEEKTSSTSSASSSSAADSMDTSATTKRQRKALKAAKGKGEQKTSGGKKDEDDDVEHNEEASKLGQINVDELLDEVADELAASLTFNSSAAPDDSKSPSLFSSSSSSSSTLIISTLTSSATSSTATKLLTSNPAFGFTVPLAFSSAASSSSNASATSTTSAASPAKKA